MDNFLKERGFYKVESSKNIRWYQKEYDLVGVLNAQIQHSFFNINQRIAERGKFWLTIKKELTGKEITYIVDLDNGQGRQECTQKITEYQLKSLLSNWENKLKQYNIYQ